MGEKNMESKQDFTHEEVLDALNMIKQICVQKQKCEVCPFYSFRENDPCAIRNNPPLSWDIEDRVYWNAFKV